VQLNHPAVEELSLSSYIIAATAGSLSILGTTAALCKQTGLVDPGNTVANSLACVAIAVHFLEGARAAALLAKSAYSRYSQREIR